jgi:ribosome-binding factor A
MAPCLKMRSTPSLSFYLDDTEKKSSHILQLIEKAVSEDN